MSDIENRKVQDILREVADNFGTFSNICNAVSELRDELGAKVTQTWCGDLADCLREIADRVDKQSVVEVTTPAPAKDPFGEIANLYPINAEEVKFVLDSYVASGCHKVPPKLGPSSDQLEPAELEALPMPAIIDVHDCIIKIRIEGSDD